MAHAQITPHSGKEKDGRLAKAVEKTALRSGKNVICKTVKNIF